MRRSKSIPRDSKGRFISSTKLFSEIFSPVRTPPINLANRYAGIREGEGSTSIKVAPTNKTPIQEGFERPQTMLQQVQIVLGSTIITQPVLIPQVESLEGGPHKDLGPESTKIDSTESFSS